MDFNLCNCNTIKNKILLCFLLRNLWKIKGADVEQGIWVFVLQVAGKRNPGPTVSLEEMCWVTPICNNVTVASNRQCEWKVHQLSQIHECFCISQFNLMNCFLNANYNFNKDQAIPHLLSVWYISNPNNIVSPFLLCFYYLLKVGLLNLVLIICWL